MTRYLDYPPKSNPAGRGRSAKADSRGSRRFMLRILAIVDEYRDRGLGPAGAWAEVLAAVRLMDRDARRD